MRVDPGLREVDVGSWSGLAHGEIEANDPDGFRRWQEGGKGWEQGESYEEMGERVVAAVLETRSRASRRDTRRREPRWLDPGVPCCGRGPRLRPVAMSGIGSTENCAVVELRADEAA